MLRTGNGSQFDLVKTIQFIEFARRCGFVHIRNSQKFSQNNGLLESRVKFLKWRIRKSSYSYLALIEHRAISSENDCSPVELLMVRRIKTTLPIAILQLFSKVINTKV